MKLTALAVALFALPLLAQDAPQTAASESTGSQQLDALAAASQAKPKQDLVAIAHASKAKKTASKSKVITNADLKKAKSQLKVHELKPLPGEAATGEPPVATQRLPKAKATEASEAAHYRDAKAAREQVTASEKKVADLQRELDTVEQSYYNENDPTYRDDVIRKRFDQTKRQLEIARKELADARDALTALAQKP